MAPPAGTLRVGRYFATLLGLFVVLYGIVFWPHQPHTPKLGLDLEGGAQVILKADLPSGKTPAKSSMEQARQIITDRVNGLGVANAEVVIQGADRIVVSVPGKSTSDLSSVSRAALLQFRPLEIAAVSAATVPTSGTPVVSPSASASASTSGSASASTSNTAAPASSTAQPRVLPHLAETSPAGTSTPASTPAASTSATPATSAGSSASATPSSSASPSASGTSTTPIDQFANLGFAAPVSATAFQALTADQQAAIQALIQAWKCGDKAKDDATKPLIACDPAGTGKYLLAPVIVAGTEISSAQANAPGSTQGQIAWSVSLSLKSKGQAQWAEYTSKHNETVTAGDIANQVAFTLDSNVIESSTIQSTINGDTQITGSFDQKSATQLANSLKYGALPLNFIEETSSRVSATLGTDQLKAGLLAGGIGLLLVVVYSLIYYRVLGVVTIASLLVSGGLTYAMLVILGTQIGFTLTLAGIAGFIVAVGITADSFVVFFERIKDEVRDGRTARVAIPRAWNRAWRTILTADFVSFLAAFVLYLFAAGDVRGFAFTLGLSTIIDLVVVFLFTHPMVSFFSRSAAFASARITGLGELRTTALAYAVPTPGMKSAKRGAGRRSPAAVTASGTARVNTVVIESAEPELPSEFADDRPDIPQSAPMDVDVDPATTPTTDVATTAVHRGATAAERAAARRARSADSTADSSEKDND